MSSAPADPWGERRAPAPADPWGERRAPAPVDLDAPLPPRLQALADVQATGVALLVDPYAMGFPHADELPEVQALQAQGWQPLGDAPLYQLLPAAWPEEHVTWVPDRRPTVWMTGAGYWTEVVAPTHDDTGWPVDEAAVAGLPPAPKGRLWLVRSPWPRIPVSLVHRVIWAEAQRTPHRDEIQLVYETALEVLRWDAEKAWAACPAEARALVDEWAAVGRVGEAAAVPVGHELGPDQVAGALARTGFDEPTLFAWLDQTGGDLDASLEFAAQWQAAGLGSSPPPGARRFEGRDLTEVRRWLDAGFDLHAADRLQSVGLEPASRWRAEGFTEAETWELLRADPTLTPDEARAFAGIARRRDWVALGFDPAAAAGWTAAGLSPGRARLWRALGKRPEDVQPGQEIPPELLAGREYFAMSSGPDGEMTTPEWDALPDPPGTRGRRAR